MVLEDEKSKKFIKNTQRICKTVPQKQGETLFIEEYSGSAPLGRDIAKKDIGRARPDKSGRDIAHRR